MRSFLRGFQELDAHNCEHLLWQIQCPVLIIAGLWDYLTPARCAIRMARRMRHSRLVVDPLSSHATLIEHPERVLGEVTQFIQVELPQFKRGGSFKFKRSKQAIRGGSASAGVKES